MATKKFAINTRPHEAEIGDDTTLLFQPEVLGDDFLDSYGRLQETTKKLNVDLSDAANVDLSQVREANVALRVFLASLMLPESAEEFARWEVRAGGKTVSSHSTPDEAKEAAEGRKGGKVVDAGLRLPDRVLVELMEWVVELYGGAGGQRPPTSSNDSATASQRPTPRGRGASPSRGSTSTRGR
ncbi:hypothetical protein [Streptomyces sp. NBC_01233]|uniref:hypothetical protein n=1 Tax=Streptomyces sp. NBC_01233 TaxID=2903787 RepID=UPI002E129536|nr:hypothetical protein OG332_23855 [Streptomyces sp. NBC_01233]